MASTNPLDEFIDMADLKDPPTNPEVTRELLAWLAGTPGVTPLGLASLKDIGQMARSIGAGIKANPPSRELLLFLEAFMSAVQVVCGFNVAFQGARMMATMLKESGSSTTTTPQVRRDGED